MGVAQQEYRQHQKFSSRVTSKGRTFDVTRSRINRSIYGTSIGPKVYVTPAYAPSQFAVSPNRLALQPVTAASALSKNYSQLGSECDIRFLHRIKSL